MTFVTFGSDRPHYPSLSRRLIIKVQIKVLERGIRMQVIQVKDLVKRYKEVVALDYFNLTVEEGKILGLLGPNGCGKTTAIHCMLNLLTYDHGDIQIFNRKMTTKDTELKRQIGIVPQELAYFENLTVYENIDFFCGLYISEKELRQRYVEEALDFVQIGEYRKFYPKKLSGGLKRRLNIACGVVHQPKLIFMDEPTVAVDAQSRQFILDGVKQLNEAGSTVVYTTHYLDEADYLCDRIVIMDKGRNVVSGSSSELKAQVATKEIVHLELVQEVSEELKARLAELPNIQDMTVHKQTVVFQFKQVGNNVVNVALLLQECQQTYLKLYSEQPSLSDVFLAFTGKELRD